jgi:hypothetical protein
MPVCQQGDFSRNDLPRGCPPSRRWYAGWGLVEVAQCSWVAERRLTRLERAGDFDVADTSRIFKKFREQHERLRTQSVASKFGS